MISVRRMVRENAHYPFNSKNSEILSINGHSMHLIILIDEGKLCLHCYSCSLSIVCWRWCRRSVE